MTIDAVKTRLATIQSGITDIKRAYAQAPKSLNPPAMVTFTGGATLAGNNGEQYTIRRIYKMRLYVATLGSGVAGEVERLCEPYFGRVWQKFMARPGLENLAGVLDASLRRDTGVIVMEYAGERYIGIEFELETTELMEVAYAPKE